MAITTPNNNANDDADDQSSGNHGERTNEGNRLIEFMIPLVTPIKGDDNQHYVAFADAPHVVVPHSPKSSTAMQLILQRYYASTGRWAGSVPKSLASDYLSAQAESEKPVTISMRAYSENDVIYLDAIRDNTIIKISSDDVTEVETGPGLFTRHGINRALPELIEVPANLRDLLAFVRIPEEALPALLACLINTWLTALPQPVILLQGTAAAGKTMGLRFLLDLVDPSTENPGSTLGKDEKILRTMSRLRRCFVFDNVSYVDHDTSDLLAKITTGAESVFRQLYSDSNPDVIQIKRPVFLNGIIEGFSRNDLASRSVAFELAAIPQSERRSPDELAAAWQQVLPGLFTALVQLASHVLHELPTVSAAGIDHRSPDLVRITAIVSDALGIDGVPYLQASIDRLSDAVLGSSTVGLALSEITQCMTGTPCHHCRHSESASPAWMRYAEFREFLARHLPEDQARDLPKLARAFAESLKRLESDLGAGLGIKVVSKRSKAGMEYQVVAA